MDLASLAAKLKAKRPSGGAPEELGSSVSTLVSQVQELVRLQIKLAKQELLALVKRNAIAAGMLAGAAVSLLFFFIIAQVWLILVIPHHALVAGIITLAWLAAAVTLALVGKTRLKIAPPQATIDSLKEDLEWVKQQIKHAPS